MAAIKLTVDRIQPGLQIRLPLKWNDHPFLLNSFKIKDHKQIEMIRHLGVKYVHFYPEQSDAIPLPVNQVKTDKNINHHSLELEAQKLWNKKQKRIEGLSAYRRRMIECEREFERSLARMRSVMMKIRNRPTAAVEEANRLVEDIVEKLMSDDNVTLHLMTGNNEFEDGYFHSLNVAIIAMMIGRAKRYSSKQLQELAFAALFHDLGKIKIPSSILRKQAPLTEPETNYLKLHTKYGLDLANQIEGFPETAKVVIAQHHELKDGSGYPRGLKGENIDEYAQLIILANAFDNLCHTPIISEQKIPYTALSHLYKNCKHLYKEENLNILIKFMGVFPPGTIVQLSNNSIGIVISVNASNLLLPNVLLYDPSVPKTQAPVIDLASKDIKIANAIHPSKLPEKIKEYLNPRARICYFIDSDN